ncbi:MAG TPA: patatin-like phospholipase family protein [Acetobacteraceae bacterium]|nr:patatin-like phospholipase family protein [Acetobacteraceae bacterium]
MSGSSPAIGSALAAGPAVSGAAPLDPLFAIFEGGGAKGMAHLGAVKAAEDLRYTFVGVAGASAGAFVAAFVAAGFRADELFDPHGPGRHLLARSGMGPTDLLGPVAWRGFRLLRWTRWLCGSSALAGLGTAAVIGLPALPIGAAAVVGSAVLPPAVVLAALFGPAWRRRGWFDPSRVADWINDQLTSRLRRYYAQAGLSFDRADVRFRDLDPQPEPADPRPAAPAAARPNPLEGNAFPLKIIATDLDARALLVFGTKETPNVRVAEAVAASIAIPGVFRPASVPSLANETDPLLCAAAGHAFADGGMVSNLPVWCFVDEKLAWEKTNPNSRRVPIVAFQLDEPRTNVTPGEVVRSVRRSVGTLAGAVGRSAVFGGQQTAQKFVEDLLIVTLRPALGVLAFDARHAEVAKAYEDGYNAATQQMSQALRLRPGRVQSELERIAKAARDHIPGTPRLRANVVVPSGPLTLRVAFTWNMDEDADDRIVLDRRGPGAAQAFRRRDAMHALLGRYAPSDRKDYLTKYALALLRPGLRSALCVPIFADARVLTLQPEQRPEPLGVLCLDSNEDLSHAGENRELLTWLLIEAAALAAALS